MKHVVTMKLEDATPGALKYRAVDEDGNELGLKDVAVGMVYVRKDKIQGQPQQITLSLDY